MISRTYLTTSAYFAMRVIATFNACDFEGVADEFGIELQDVK
jgi:hypothetical protein